MLRVMEAVSDAELMQRYVAGDARAFDELYGRHRAALFRFLARQVSHAVAQDLFQETWSRVVAHRQRYEPRAKFRTFLFTIAHHCYIDWLRARGRDATYGAEPIEPDDAHYGDHEQRSVDALAASMELGHRLKAAIQALPEAQREAFLLHEESGLDLPEIAAITGVGAETVKSRLRYAVGKLRQSLAAYRELPEPATAGAAVDV